MVSVDDNSKILFVVNPISGMGMGKRFTEVITKLKEYKRVDYTVRYTQYAGHAKILVNEALQEKIFTHIVAVGGDGTVNEVGIALYGTDTIFGIVSLGSGNGFARHLGYSVFMKRALRQILTGSPIKLDVVEMNGDYFLNVSGIGFDAEVAHEFNKYKIRGFFAYILAGLRTWYRYKEKEYTITYDGKTITRKCFILSFANSSQYGNNVVIAPQASLTDGLLDICVLKRPPFWRCIFLPFYFLSSKLTQFPYFEEIKCEEARIEGDISKAHLDGEAIVVDQFLELKIHKQVLNTVVPKKRR